MNKGVVFLGLLTGVAVAMFAYALMQTGDSMDSAPDRSLPLPENAVAFSGNQNALTPIQPVPEYTLTDHKGETFKLSSMSGKVWAVDFFFTMCPGQCSVMSTNMAYLLDTFKDDDRFGAVSISVDMANDTPERLAEYAKLYEADTDRWHFVRGDEDTLRDIATNGLRLGTVKDLNFHSEHFVLVGSENWIRGYYDGTDTNRIADMVKHIRIALDNTPES